MKAGIADVCEIINGFAFKSENYTTSGIRIIRIANVQKGYVEDNTPQYYPLSEVDKIQQYILNEGDILLSLTGNVGRVAVLEKQFLPAALNQRVACLRPNIDILTPRYLFYALLSSKFEKDCIEASRGIAQKNMSTEWLKQYPINLRDINEQIKITNRLDLLTRIITRRRTQLAKLDELVKCRFVELFGDPVSPILKWNQSTFGQEFEIFSGGTPSTGVDDYWSNGTIPWIGSNMCQDVVLTSTDGKYITEEGFRNSSAKWAHSGYVLVALVGATIGKTALLTLSTTTNQNVASINVPDNQNYTSEYIYMLLRFLYAKFLDLGNGGFKMANLSFVRQLPLPSPPIDLQNHFSDFVHRIDKLRFVDHVGGEQSNQSLAPQVFFPASFLELSQ